MVKLVDPLKQPKAEFSAGELFVAPMLAKSPLKASLAAGTALSFEKSLEQLIKEDFRVFLTLIWRHLLGVDPSPIQLDMAYWLQHGPDRAIIMAFRGFSKSWITGAYALWRLYCNPEEKVMIISGSLARAVATTNWALSLIMTMPLLKHMIPGKNYRQSGQQFDVGSCVNIGQSASFSAFGIGSQLVGFRGSCIIPDDVETQTNSLTTGGREKNKEAVKEFESVLTPGGVIKYLGTPHDVDSLYMHLLKLKDEHGKPVYAARIWPALFPTTAQTKVYNHWLAPYITHEINRLGPSCVGHSTMPNRFPDEDLMRRRAAMGASEFTLQFMLDLSGSLLDKYPLKLKNLIVLPLDDRKGPEEIVWGNSHVDRDLPVMGLDGDFFHRPAHVGSSFQRWTKVIAFVDSSGRGEDETAMSTTAELYGTVFWLDLYASKEGYSPPVLKAISQRCVRFGVHELYIEANFGDGMFTALLRPVLLAAWEEANKNRRVDEWGGTKIIETKTGQAQKERRMLSVLEPVTQQHRLVVNRELVEYDMASVNAMEGEDDRHRYSLFYQFTHITRERDCLGHEDRLESLAGCLAMFAGVLGVDPMGVAARAKNDREQDWLEDLLDEADEVALRASKKIKDNRAEAGRVTPR